MSISNPRQVVYEQPLSERIRAFLRLEFLFARAEHQLQSVDAWSSRVAMESIIDVLAVMSRSDLKKELLKELERQSSTLGGLESNRNVDQQRLREILGRIKSVLATLHASENALGQELRDHDLLSTVRQRSSIPAGTCGFDLPAYHHWLQRAPEERLGDLRGWLSCFDCLREAVDLSLRLVRESAIATQETARGPASSRKTLETSTPCQMIRVSVPETSACYPEISAGKAPLHGTLYDAGRRERAAHPDHRRRFICAPLLRDMSFGLGYSLAGNPKAPNFPGQTI